ncbi:MAG: hypothetical protein H7289_11925 [Mucilaginibacter sp.]|nr:hypothetical protein [Mucilaginibacter sp.]
MKNLNKIGKALLIIVCFITFNIFMDIFLFNEKMLPQHLGAAIFGGIGSGLAVFFISNRKKSKAAKFGSDLTSATKH